MKLMTQEIRAKIPKLGANEHLADHMDAIVQVKFFNPIGSATWWVTEFDGHDIMFGYVTGAFEDEWGYLSLSEMAGCRVGSFSLGIERDRHFTPKPLREALAQYYPSRKVA